MGKTQGVRRAAKPQRMASMMSDQSDPLPAASLVAGAAISASGAAGIAGLISAAGTDSAFAPAGTVIVSSVSSGGMQLVSSQIIHSIWALAVACSAVRCTRCANCAFPEKVPISIENISS